MGLNLRASKEIILRLVPQKKRLKCSDLLRWTAKIISDSHDVTV